MKTTTLNGGPYDGMKWSGARDAAVVVTREFDQTHHRYELNKTKTRYVYAGAEKPEGAEVGTNSGANGAEGDEMDELSL